MVDIYYNLFLFMNENSEIQNTGVRVNEIIKIKSLRKNVMRDGFYNQGYNTNGIIRDDKRKEKKYEI